MEIYLIDKNNNEIKRTYSNVINWSYDFVKFINGGFASKIYCDSETEYFSDNKYIIENSMEEGEAINDD